MCSQLPRRARPLNGLRCTRDQDFQRRRVATNDAMAIVASPGLANAASSIVVAECVWETCTHAYFRGRCVELLPGNYPHTDVDLNGRIASVRQVADAGRSTPIVITAQHVIVNPAPVVISAPQIVASPAPIVVNPASVVVNPAPVVVNPAPVAGSAQRLGCAAVYAQTASPRPARWHFSAPVRQASHGFLGNNCGVRADPGPTSLTIKFELVINLITAKVLRITIPPSLLLRADGVIQ